MMALPISDSNQSVDAQLEKNILHDENQIRLSAKNTCLLLQSSNTLRVALKRDHLR